MGKSFSRLYRKIIKRKKVYVTTDDKNKYKYKNENENEDEEDDENEFEGYPYIPFYKPDEYEETASKFVSVKNHVHQHLDLMKKQAQQAIIDATIVTTRQNTYGNKAARTDMVPNRYILKSMLSRSTKHDQELFVKHNEQEILQQIGVLQTIQGYHRDEFVDDHMILHEHEAYMSTMNYLLVSPTQQPEEETEEKQRRNSIGNSINSKDWFQ